MLRMVGGHACYTPFDPEKLFKEDAPGAEVKNRFLNRCFVYILYQCCIADPHSCLSWIFPTSSSDKDLERLSKRTMPAGDPNHPGKMISFLGPEIAASVAAAVMSLPWHTFHGLRNPPPFLEWYQRQLQHFRTWGRDACAEKIRAAFKEFLDKFPDALNCKGSRRKSSGPSAPATQDPEDGAADISTMPP